MIEWIKHIDGIQENKRINYGCKSNKKSLAGSEDLLLGFGNRSTG